MEVGEASGGVNDGSNGCCDCVTCNVPFVYSSAYSNNVVILSKSRRTALVF